HRPAPLLQLPSGHRPLTPPFSSPFIRAVELRRDEESTRPTGYPWNLPAIAALAARLPLDPHVTYLIGENGSGKSTLLEAIAVAAGMNAEGGSSNFAFS